MGLTEDQQSILKILLRAKPKLQKALLQNADKKLIQTLCECVLNILVGNVPVKERHKQKLARHKTLLRNIVKKGVDWKQKKKVIQKGGTFFLSILAPIVSTILSSIL